MQNIDQILSDHERYARREAGGCRAQFQFANLPNQNLQRRQLKEIEFVGCNLRGSHMSLSNFSFASFYGTDLSLCDLRGAHLVRADLRGAGLAGARLCFANLDGADFRKAALAQASDERGLVRRSDLPAVAADAQCVDFSDCSMRGARLANTKLQGAKFDGASLEGADLQGAVLTGATFKGTILNDANLDGIQVSDGAFDDALMPPSAEALQRKPELMKALADSRLWMTSSGKEGAKAVLDGADLRVLQDGMKKARLAGASLKSVCAVGLDFSGAALVAADFSGADLRHANFSGADLRGCNFRDCNLTQANLSGANLEPLTGRNGRLYQPRFSGAQLVGVLLSESRMDPALRKHLAAAANPPLTPMPSTEAEPERKAG